jgi:hypothetical protein
MAATKVLTELKSRIDMGPDTRTRTFLGPLTRSQWVSFCFALSMTQSCNFNSSGPSGSLAFLNKHLR